ncbi:MAG: hypothetical protein OM95_08130 [Bdellovibrio sp. ArHS]|nr:MAG: hypothetical protein OM95_08130 [Bdellovibrio sp. ArHS]
MVLLGFHTKALSAQVDDFLRKRGLLTSLKIWCSFGAKGKRMSSVLGYDVLFLDSFSVSLFI